MSRNDYIRKRNRIITCQIRNMAKVLVHARDIWQRKKVYCIGEGRDSWYARDGTESWFARERNRAKVCKRKEQSYGMPEKGTESR
jgi:hypothetical protein